MFAKSYLVGVDGGDGRENEADIGGVREPQQQCEGNRKMVN